MEILIVLITVATSVLYFILFFKIWGMTDDIKAIKNTTVKEDFGMSITRKVAFCKMLNKEQEAYEFILNRMNLKLETLTIGLNDSCAQSRQKEWEKVLKSYESLLLYVGYPMPDKYKNFSFEKLIEYSNEIIK